MSEAEALGSYLIDARRDGQPFEEAWPRALTAARSHIRRLPSAIRPDALAALIATEEGWRRAFEGEPPLPGEAAAAFLLDALDSRDALDEPLGVPVGMVLG